MVDVNMFKNRICRYCKSINSYNERHDAMFCSVCDRWAEENCGDLSCVYCDGRPEKPSFIYIRNINMNKYLSIEERRIIQQYLDDKRSVRDISEVLNRPQDTLYREISRSGGKRRYNAEEAQASFDDKIHAARLKNRKSPIADFRIRLEALEEEVKQLKRFKN